MTAPADVVLILGGGIHGTAIARELLLNGVSVVLADSGDISSGATSKSSRLIHGGLRYLEYGDIRLVRESLTERGLNLQLAPNFVRPLRLFIPLRESWSGLIPSAVGFLGAQRTIVGRWLSSVKRPRGLWPVRVGLSMYDWLAGESSLPPSSVASTSDPQVPRVDPARYRSLVSYSDAQMPYPERFVAALLADAEDIARGSQLSFTVATYCQLQQEATGWRITSPLQPQAVVIHPAVIVNACGAAGDHTLRSLGMEVPPLLGGTKGSHILTWHAGLRQALNGQAVYAEAADGRPVFILPFGDGLLIGTTDEVWVGPPEEAIATEAEIAYLLAMVLRVFGISLTRDDVVAHYSGVRPLPRSTGLTNAAISRDHSLQMHQLGGIPVLTLVGGKLTTWRVFAEQATDHVLGKLGRVRYVHTRHRSLPGNAPLPDPSAPQSALFEQWAREYSSTPAEVTALWSLYGTRLTEVLEAVRQEPRREIADTPISDRVIRWIIRHEHVARLADLIERRLLTVFQQHLSRQHVRDLAACMVDVGVLSSAEVETAIDSTIARLQRHYGRRFDD